MKINPASGTYLPLNITIVPGIAKKPGSPQLNGCAAELCLSKETLMEREQNPRTHSETKLLTSDLHAAWNPASSQQPDTKQYKETI